MRVDHKINSDGVRVDHVNDRWGESSPYERDGVRLHHERNSDGVTVHHERDL